MITKLGKKLLSIPTDSKYIFGSSQTKTCFTGKDAAGNAVNIGLFYPEGNLNFLTSITASGASSSQGIAVGSGNTAATEDDYTIESIISNLTVTATPTVSSDYDTTNGKYIFRVDLALSNATASDIVVKEVCRFSKVFTTASLNQTPTSSATYARSVMIDRTVLETPLTVPANGAAILRYAFIYDADPVPAS